jgi:hypothetical protein
MQSASSPWVISFMDKNRRSISGDLNMEHICGSVELYIKVDLKTRRLSRLIICPNESLIEIKVAAEMGKCIVRSLSCKPCSAMVDITEAISLPSPLEACNRRQSNFLHEMRIWSCLVTTVVHHIPSASSWDMR